MQLITIVRPNATKSINCQTIISIDYMPVEEEICIIYSSSGAGYTTVGQTLDDYNNLLEMLGEGINAQLQDNRKPLFLVERGGE